MPVPSYADIHKIVAREARTNGCLPPSLTFVCYVAQRRIFELKTYLIETRFKPRILLSAAHAHTVLDDKHERGGTPPLSAIVTFVCEPDGNVSNADF